MKNKNLTAKSWEGISQRWMSMWWSDTRNSMLIDTRWCIWETNNPHFTGTVMVSELAITTSERGLGDSNVSAKTSAWCLVAGEANKVSRIITKGTEGKKRKYDHVSGQICIPNCKSCV